jgi:hypothetical protein
MARTLWFLGLVLLVACGDATGPSCARKRIAQAVITHYRTDGIVCVDTMTFWRWPCPPAPEDSITIVARTTCPP